MPLQKQTISIPLGGQEKHGSSKLQPLGRLSLVEQAYQLPGSSGAYHKRNGVSATDRTTDTGSITTAYDVSNTGDALVLRTSNSVFTRSAAQSKWLYKGARAVVSPTVITSGLTATSTNTALTAQRPSHVLENGRIWSFWAGNDGNGYYSCVDQSTNVEILPATSLGIAATWILAAASGSYIWAFVASASSELVKVVKISTAAPGTIVTSTYYTIAGVGAVCGSIDLVTTSSGITIGIMESFGGNIFFSILDTATSLPAASPGTVTYNTGVPLNPIVFAKNRATTSFYAYYRRFSGVGSVYDIKEIIVTSSTLVAAAATGPVFTRPDSDFKVGLCVYVDPSTGYRVLFQSDTSASTENAVIKRYVWNGTLISSDTGWHRAAWVAADPFEWNSNVYVLIGHDDTFGLQNSFYLVDASTAKHLGKALYGEAGDVFHRCGILSGLQNVDYRFRTNVTVSGNTVCVVVPSVVGRIGYSSTASDYRASCILWDMMPTYGPSASSANGQEIISPSGWPAVLGAEGALVEASPTMFPREITPNSGNVHSGVTLTTGDISIYATYAAILRDGSIIRSAPSPVVIGNTSGNADRSITVVVPTLRFSNAGAAYVIELWASAQDDPLAYLYLRKVNDPTADSVTFEIATNPTAAEILYTVQGEEANSPVPACKLAASWKDRVFLSQTDAPGEIWPSKVFQAGRALWFSAGDILTISDGTGDVRAMGAIDYNYFAFFKYDGIWIIDGNGPDDTGAGNYEARRLPTESGCTNPNSVVNGQGGLYYQAVDGGIYVLTGGLSPMHVGRGIESLMTGATLTITAAVAVPNQGQMRFFTNDSRCFVLDYWNPPPSPNSPEDGVGQWYVWTMPSSAVSATVMNGVCYYADSTGKVWYEVASQWYDNTNTEILPKYTFHTQSHAGLLKAERIYRAQVLGTWLGNSTLKVTSTPRVGSFTAGSATVATKAVTASVPAEVEWRPNPQRATAINITVEEASSGNLTEGFTFEALAFEIGTSGKLRRLATTQRI